MQVNIWSDVRCPFCYIGKHKFENALAQFPHKDQIEVIWRSFELDPGLQTNPELNTVDHLAKIKGISKDEAQQMNQYVAKVAEDVNLQFHFDKAIVANSFNAHRLIQFAKTKNLGGRIEELLFQAHFKEGKNIDDKDTLRQIGLSTGLEEQAIEEALSSDDYAYKVRQDQAKARSFGIQGVPYFIFNDTYAISGAQPTEIFLNALQKSWSAFDKESRQVIFNEGISCSTDGNCN